MRRALAVGVAGVLLVGLTFALRASGADKAQPKAAKEAPAKAAVERARKSVRMLDDVYKTTVVLITDKYVNEEDDFPAGSAAIALFEAITEKGWHAVRLLDVSGKPYAKENVAKDEFEKAGVEQMKAGKDYYEQIVRKDDKQYLRAMTAVPVVMQKCVMCHPNYADAKKGEAVGAISYTVPIE